MNKENKSDLGFPNLFSTDWELIKTPEILEAVWTTSKNTDEILSFSDFKIWIIDKPIIDNEKKEIEEKNKKLTLLFNHFKYLKEIYHELVKKYPKNIDKIKDIFINIWIIKTSNIHSKDNIENNLLGFIKTENYETIEIYINKLINNWEWKKWFPSDVWFALLKIQKLCWEIFPTKNKVFGNENNWNIWMNVWWGKIR